MDTLLSKINKLQDVLSLTNISVDIDLPQIVVVGSQSSGKSSVLEHIIERDVLPRGNGIVTRRPLVLQLIKNVEKNQDGFIEYGIFLHSKKIFNNFDEIKKEIIDETERETKGKNISSRPINLKIFAPNVPNLTLVDLPGLTQIATEGQDKKIVEIIRKMAIDYISKKNSLILAITSANSDIATSEALKIAREVDSEGKRTICVLTKIDLMDKGSDCLDVLNGKLYKLEKGYIGLALRSQYDINNKKTIQNAIIDEKKYFEQHEVYGKIASRMGTTYLSKKLSEILYEHIKTCLPEIKNKILNGIRLGEDRLVQLGVNKNVNMSESSIMLNIINSFSYNYSDLINGNGNLNISNCDELFGGARINHVITNKYLSTMKFDCDCSEKDIKMSIKNSKGITSTLFITESAFISLAKIQIKKLLDPALKCVDEIYKELSNIIDSLCKEIVEYPLLKIKIKELILSHFKNYINDLKSFILNLIEIEIGYIEMEHPDFLDGEKISQLLEKFSGRSQKSNSNVNIKVVETVIKYDKEKIECDIVAQLLKSYMNIIKKNVYSNVAKSIMHFLINKSKSELQSILIKNLYKDEMFSELLKKDVDVVNQITKINRFLQVLKTSYSIIEDIDVQ